MKLLTAQVDPGVNAYEAYRTATWTRECKAFFSSGPFFGVRKELMDFRTL